MRKKIIVLGILGMISVSAAWAGGDAIAGKEKTASCQACHGVDGNSPLAIYPILAGQYETYLLQSLRSYKSGTRKNPIMQGMVAALSERDMADVAAYYASQSGLVNTTP